MKKNLRLLCLGLAAATFTCGFAQDDVTSELKNADMELGLKGWAFDGTDYMGKNTKDVNRQVGFHGMNKGVQETWHANANNPLGDSYVMQRVKKLPAGTYVFGAYAAAAAGSADRSGGRQRHGYRQGHGVFCRGRDHLCGHPHHLRLRF